MSKASVGINPADDFCVRCGLSKSSTQHDKQTMGWHPLRGQDYIDALEDALLFVRNHNQPHRWQPTGITIDTPPSFPEKRCAVCGEINWGGREDGPCFGNRMAVIALNVANNRRATAAIRV